MNNMINPVNAGFICFRRKLIETQNVASLQKFREFIKMQDNTCISLRVNKLKTCFTKNIGQTHGSAPTKETS